MSDQITPAQFDSALADAEWSQVTIQWKDHVARHHCFPRECAVRAVITRAIVALDDLRNNTT